jgi:hypothetical protein
MEISNMYRVLGWIVFLSLSPFATAQQENTGPRLDGREGRDLLLRLYNPKSTMRVEQHFLKRARFPVVDVHSHFRRFNGRPDDIDQFVEMMDRNFRRCQAARRERAEDLESFGALPA